MATGLCAAAVDHGLDNDVDCLVDGVAKRRVDLIDRLVVDRLSVSDDASIALETLSVL